MQRPITMQTRKSRIKDANALSVEALREVMPQRMKKSITLALLDQINNTITDSVALDQFRENLLSLTTVLKAGRFRLDQYICAVKYVSLISLGDGKKDAYLKTFPGKWLRMQKEGISNANIKAYASAYHGTKLVTLVLEQMLVPVHLLNAAMFQEALNVQATLMRSARSEKVRSDAASSLLTHLKPPDVRKIELDLTYNEDDSVKALRAASLALAERLY